MNKPLTKEELLHYRSSNGKWKSDEIIAFLDVIDPDEETIGSLWISYLLRTVPGYDLKLLDISFLDMVKKSIK